MRLWTFILFLQLLFPNGLLDHRDGGGDQPVQMQLRAVPDRQVRDQASVDECLKIIESVREGIENANLSRFAPSFGSQVLIYLRDGESGYYSSSQAYYVLEDHFRSRKVLSIEFDTVREADPMPYATGTILCNVKGLQERAQIYVSLEKSEGKWVIAQVKIY
jgi:Domain of unknown function (DUF4783)